MTMMGKTCLKHFIHPKTFVSSCSLEYRGRDTFLLLPSALSWRQSDLWHIADWIALPGANWADWCVWVPSSQGNDRAGDGHLLAATTGEV